MSASPIVLLGMMKYTTFVSGDAAEAPVAYALKDLGAQPLFALGHRDRRADGDDLVAAGLSVRPGAHLVRHVARRPVPEDVFRGSPKFKTPHWSTWIAGFAVGIPAGIFDIGDAADLSNIGTLFAFVLVSLGVIFLRRTQPDRPRVSAFRLCRGSR